MVRRLTKYRRTEQGGALAEFAPALLLVFIFGLLPVLDAIFIGIDYASARYLNELQLREAQKLPKSQATSLTGPIIQTIPNTWKQGLIGGLANSEQSVNTQVTYTPVPWQPVGSNQTENFWFVSIATTVSFRPFLSIPFFKAVPGLGSPVTFSVSGRRPVENNRFLNE